MHKQPRQAKRGTGKRILLGMLVLVGFVGGWCGVVLLIRPWTAVKIRTLQSTPVPTGLSRTIASLRVGCYNIAHGRGGVLGASNWQNASCEDQHAHLAHIGQLLASLKLDIVVLNEVDFASLWSAHINQAEVIAQEAGYPYLLEQRNVDLAIPFVSLRFGNAVLSKYPLSDAQFLNYPNVSTLSKLAVNGLKKGVVCTVSLPENQQLRVVAVHLAVNSERVRVASVKQILEQYVQSTLPFLLMGDFNTAPRGYPQYYTDDDGLNSVELVLSTKPFSTHLPTLPLKPHVLTFPSERPDCVIDWIIPSSPWRIQQQTVIASSLSDHLPVIAVLTQESLPLTQASSDVLTTEKGEQTAQKILINR